MIEDEAKRQHYYEMLLEKNSSYEGLFFVGVKTTGVFCRPTCPAKKPLLKNCEFFDTAQEALLASYRPCKRCNPLSSPTNLSEDVKSLVREIEKNPQKNGQIKTLISCQSIRIPLEDSLKNNLA